MSNQRYSVTIDVGANISKIRESMKEVSQLLSSSNLDKGIASGYEKKLEKLRSALIELESKTSQPLKSDAEARGVERSLKKVNDLVSELGLSFKELQGRDLSKIFGDFTKPVQELKSYIKEFERLEKAYDRAESTRESKRSQLAEKIAEKNNLITNAKNSKQNITQEEDLRRRLLRENIRDQEKLEKSLVRKNTSLQSDLKGAQSVTQDTQLKNKVENFEALSKSVADANKEVENFETTYSHLFKDGKLNKTKLTKADKAKNFNSIAEIQRQIDENEKQILDSRKKRQQLEEQAKANPTIKEYDKQIEGLETDKTKLQNKLNELNDITKSSQEKLQKSFEELRNSFKKITGNESFDNLDYSVENFKKLQQIAQDFSQGKFDEAAKQLQEMGTALKTVGDGAEGLEGKIRPGLDELSRSKEISDDFDHLTWRLKYFFSLAGGFNLMRRAIRSAVTTTKELDAAMTQTAVVSTYTVSDMWKTLPKYSKEASKLGVAIKDVYNAQTLYVQQGLDMNTAMDIGVETMKMARVAGIGAEEATNSMTAALRGFNMAIDEKSAQRINDVYSKLAQNTASNVQEISTAMTKTAALANSANMSFENTAAFLATIIESTREGAETAGTALKTVIARFSEVKQLYTKNQLTGTDEEGQEIDVNKISKALRTAGINMNEFFMGTKGLDEIFKELGSKWNNLSTVQQRYIATQAAGSRQQSRFLALMQNYERTVELTNMAYNSAGSGQEQFEKTLDSLSAKMEQLKNSWDTLLMGLANSDAIKGIVDFGTSVLDIINKIIAAISGESGLTKALVTLSLGVGTFKIGKSIFGKSRLLSNLVNGQAMGKIPTVSSEKGQEEQVLSENSKQVEKIASSYNLLANAALMAGAAITLVGTSLKKSNKISEKAADSIISLGTGITAAAAAAKVLQSISTVIPALGGGVATGIAVAIGAIVTVIGLIDAAYESAEEKSKRINESISQNQTRIKDLENGYKQVDDSLGSIIEKQDNLNKLTEGTIAWKDAVKELNTEIQTLVQNFPDFLNAIEIGEGGEWTINVDQVRQIQQEKREAINNSKKANLALQYTKQLNDIGTIKSKSEFWQEKEVYNEIASNLSGAIGIDKEAIKREQEKSIVYTALDKLLQTFNYDKYSQGKINSLIEYLKKNKNVKAEELPEEFNWFKDIVAMRPYFTNLISQDSRGISAGSYKFNTDDYLLQLAQGMSLYKQLGAKEKEMKSDVSSSLISYLIENLDEKLPQEIYGGAFRKFIFQQVKDLAQNIEIKPISDEEFTDLKSIYYDYLGYELKGTKYYNGDEEVEDHRDEIEAFAVIYDLINEVDSTLSYFEKNANDFTLGKLSLRNYEEAKNLYNPEDIEYQIADYYIGVFTSWNNLQKELYGELDSSSFSFNNKLKANIVGQVESIIRDTKNNFGKNAALDVESFIEYLYNGLFPKYGTFDEDTFTSILSGIESGEIITLDQLQAIVPGLDFKGYDFDRIRNLITRQKTSQDWINNFSDELSFLNSLREGKTTFTKEEKNKLLITGKYKDTDFISSGSGFELQGYAVNDIAESYFGYIRDMINTSFEQTENALKKKKSFDEIRGKLKTNDSKVVDFLSQNFNDLTEEEIKNILAETFKIDKLYNPNTGNLIDLLNENGNLAIDIDTLKSIYLPWLFDTKTFDLENTKNILTNFKDSLENAVNQLPTNTYQTLTNYIQGIIKSRGISRGNSLMSQLLNWNNEEAFKEWGTDNNRFPEFLGAIEKLDWSNINTIEDFNKALTEQGIILNKSTDQFKELYNTFREIYKLGKIITADEIKQLAQYGLQLKNEIKNKTDAAYTKEQRDYLVNAQKELADQFVYNAETGGYTYIGNKKVLEQTAQQAAITTGYEQLQAQRILSQGEAADFGSYTWALEKLYGQKYWEDLTDEQRAEVKTFEESERAKQIAQEYEAATEALKYAGLNNDQVRGLGGSKEQQIAATMQDAAAQGFSIEDLQQYTQELSNVENITEELAYAIAYDAMLMNKGVDDLRTNFSSLKTVIGSIKTGEDGSLIIETQEQLQSLSALNKIIQNITGTTANFSHEFLAAEDTLKLLQGILNGDKDALNDFRKAAAKDLLPKDLDKAPKEFRQLQAAIDKLDLSNVKVGDLIDEGIEGVIDNLLEMGTIGIEQASAIYEALGFEPPEFEPQTISYDADMPDITTEEVSDSGKMKVTVPATPLSEASTAEGSVSLDMPVPAADGGTAGKRRNGSHATAKTGSESLKTPSKGGGGGGGKKFKNDFDKYYNQVEDINELERQRNLLEKDYNQLLKSENKSGKDIYNNLTKQLKLLEKRRELTADLAEKRKQQLFDAMQDKEYKKVWKYAKWNEEDQTIEIDWDAIDKIKNSKTGDLVKEYVKILEDYQGKYDDMINALEEIEDDIQDIKQRGKEQYTTLEDRTRDALIKQIQDKIDEFSAVDEAINDTNQKLFDSISQTLELQRQERENQKTEEDLSDKEKRLAYLQQDSSNANALEIAKLQEELADAREDYTDQLIDQKISELQQQNDEAQEARQQQIELMQQSLDWQEKSGAFWDEVYRLINEGTSETATLVHESELENLLKTTEGWEGLSQIGQMEWLKELNTLVSEGMAYISMSRQLEDLGVKEGTEVTFTNKEGETLTGIVDKDGNVVVTDEDGTVTVYEGVYQDYSGDFRTLEEEGIIQESEEVVQPETTTPKKKKKKKKKQKAVAVPITAASNGAATAAANAVANVAQTAAAAAISAVLAKINGYASGGVADFTGPAWLDGTKSRPELVLNARDTQNFLELKDTLSSLKSNGGFNLNGGDNYYDIKVQVDSLSSDYDVDKAIDRIKARIAQDGAYRNVNTLSRLR